MGRWRAGCRALSVAIVALALAAPAARAAGDDEPRDACGPAPGDAPAQVAAVEDAGDVRLADGRTLRLVGLDVPSSATTAPAVRRAIADWAGTGLLTVRALAGETDRWGRTPAMLFRPDAPEPSAAAMLLASGLARARPDALAHPCFAAFLAAEAQARAAGRGIWADPADGVIRAGDAAAIARASGGFAILEGILAVHAARGGTVYLTLGRDRWGFAAVLTRRDAARLARTGFDVADYAGTPVRLRGDLDDRFGARIRFTDPDQLESLEPGSMETPAP